MHHSVIIFSAAAVSLLPLSAQTPDEPEVAPKVEVVPPDATKEEGAAHQGAAVEPPGLVPQATGSNPSVPPEPTPGIDPGPVSVGPNPIPGGPNTIASPAVTPTADLSPSPSPIPTVTPSGTPVATPAPTPVDPPPTLGR